MTELENQKLKWAIEQTNAIFSLEGFDQTADTKAIDAALLAGRITSTQAAEELNAYASEHKTIRGFIASRTWADPAS